MEEFYDKTRQTFRLEECTIDDINCKYDWKVMGSLEGECLTFSAGDRQFLRNVELRITIHGNDSGIGLTFR